MNATTTVKQVRFAKLEIHNFKGTKELVVNFSDDMTIGGANRTGKSTFLMQSPGAYLAKTAKTNRTLTSRTPPTHHSTGRTIRSS